MTDLQQAITKLMSSPHYQELAAYEPPFNPFEAMGVTYRELTHSRVLAWLLRDKANKEFRQQFVEWIAAKSKLGLDVPDDSEDAKLEHVNVRTEYADPKDGRIDVFAHFPSLELVIGIEVKIWAGEQPEQIDRYQTILHNRKYLECQKVVVFLTPRGRSSETNKDKRLDEEVPVLNMSWGKVAEIIGKLRPGQGAENNFRMQFQQHLERNITMNNVEERRIVRELLSEGDNERTIQRIINNMPPLDGLLEQWKKIVAEVCGYPISKFELSWIHSERGTKKELNIRCPTWDKVGLPFTLMLYKYANAATRILVYKDHFNEHKDKLTEFADSSNGIVGKFPKVDRWPAWHSVLAEDGGREEIKETFINIYSKDWAQQAKEKLSNQMEDLLPLIKDWVSKHQ